MERDGDVEGNAMSFRQDGLGIGADLVRDLAGFGEHAVGADDDQIDPALLRCMSQPAALSAMIR